MVMDGGDCDDSVGDNDVGNDDDNNDWSRSKR